MSVIPCDGRPAADAYSAALDKLDDRQCADCGYPLGDKPVFLGGVWFCATCNPAIFSGLKNNWDLEK